MKLLQQLISICESKVLEENLSLQALAAKYNLKLKQNGKAIEEFEFNSQIEKDFAENGFMLNFNNKKNHFDVISDKSAAEAAKKQELIAARKEQGFNASGTRRTFANVGGGHSVNGIKSK